MIEYVPVTTVLPTTPKLSGVKQEQAFYCYLLRFWSLTGLSWTVLFSGLLCGGSQVLTVGTAPPPMLVCA